MFPMIAEQCDNMSGASMHVRVKANKEWDVEEKSTVQVDSPGIAWVSLINVERAMHLPQLLQPFSPRFFSQMALANLT